MTVANRREREQQVRKELIIEVSRKLFEQKGFELTTVDEIAASAELGKGTIYSYFKSKEEIYIAILEKGLENLKDRMTLAVKEPISAVEALRSLYDTFVEYLRERRGFTEVLFLQVEDSVLYRLGGLASGLKTRALDWMELVSNLLQWGIERGEFIPCNVEQMAKMIIGLIMGLIVQYEMGQITEDLANYREVVFQLVLKGIQQPSTDKE